MFNVVLIEPEIPPNTGNVIRLCANTGCQLHLIEPLGFDPDDKKLRRAGLDYHDWAQVSTYADYEHYLGKQQPTRVFTFSTHHRQAYTQAAFRPGDALVFGPETRGLPEQLRNCVPEQQRLTIPMLPNNRSLNLSNSVAVVVYEAWRQNQFSAATQI